MNSHFTRSRGVEEVEDLTGRIHGPPGNGEALDIAGDAEGGEFVRCLPDHAGGVSLGPDQAGGRATNCARWGRSSAAISPAIKPESNSCWLSAEPATSKRSILSLKRTFIDPDVQKVIVDHS